MPDLVGVFRDRHSWAVCDLKDGRATVRTHARSVSLAGPLFTVSQQGRKEHLQGNYIPSHAMIIGQLADNGSPATKLELLTYNPISMHAFHTVDDPVPVYAAAFALLDDYGHVWAA